MNKNRELQAIEKLLLLWHSYPWAITRAVKMRYVGMNSKKRCNMKIY